MSEVLLGQDQWSVVYAEIKEDRTIRGFNTYDLVDRDNSYDGNYYLSMNGWCHDVEINGVTYKSGMKLAEEVTPHFENQDVAEIVTNEDFYFDEGHYCSECGTFHSSEQYYNVSYVILNECELFCKTCVGADDLIAETPVTDVDDIYNARDIVGLDPERFEEVETIFHDCGWGGPATNHDGAKRIIDNLLEEHEKLYAALTGIGQFQVYVTLYKEA